jgi:mutator protein MutT
MGYVSDLRAKIGHAPCVIAFSVMIVTNEKNEVLLEERADDGFWDFPGGSVEIGETAEEAAKRELQEETGLLAKSFSLFGVYSGPLAYYHYVNGDEVYGVDVVYWCQSYEGKRKLQAEEVRQMVWYPLSEVPKKLSVRNLKIVEDLKSRIR